VLPKVEKEFLMLEVFFIQLVAAVLGTASIAAADLLYKAGHVRRGPHTLWVACSTTAICVPLLAWILNVFLGPGVLSHGLVGILVAVMFCWVYRNLRKLPAPQKSTSGFPGPRSLPGQVLPPSQSLATLTSIENAQERDQQNTPAEQRKRDNRQHRPT
jgi:hypothetical protein